MNRLLFILIFLPLFCFGQWSNEKINTSFIDHAGACMLITAGTVAVVEGVFPKFEHSRVVGFAVGMAAGLLKEFFEDQPDQIDLAADFTGCCLGFTITLAWYKDSKKRWR